MTTVFQHLRRSVMARDTAAFSDGQLLSSFLTQREEAAFAALVRRHGPMVFGVCRRVLGNPEDAEDAFQATFLVLARKASSVRPRDRVGAWLHGVALRTASKARCRAARRSFIERQVRPERTHDLPSDEGLWRDLRPLLDVELQRLPEVYRDPVVLCDLEGASRGEAARKLGVPEGTISSRLARGREMLGHRLRQRGVTLGAGVLALVLTKEAAATMPLQLIETTVVCALCGASAPVAALADGVIHAMLFAKFKLAAAVLAVVGIVSIGLGVGAHQVLAEKPKPAAVAEANAADKGDKPAAGQTVVGVVEAADVTKGTLTLKVQEAPGKKETVERTYTLAKDVKIHLEHGLKKETRDGTPADISQGATVTAQLSADKKTIVSVSVRAGLLHGSVKSVNVAQNTITVSSKLEKEDKTFTLTPDTKVFIDDGQTKKGDSPTPGKLADAAEGLIVVVQMSGYDRTQAVSIRLSGPTLNARVKSVDKANNTITVTTKGEGDKTLKLAKDVKIDGDKLEALPNANVSLRLSATDRTTVVAINPGKQ